MHDDLSPLWRWRARGLRHGERTSAHLHSELSITVRTMLPNA